MSKPARPPQVMISTETVATFTRRLDTASHPDVLDLGREHDLRQEAGDVRAA